LYELEQRMRDLLARLNRPNPEFTFETEPQHDGTPHVEVGPDGLDWVHTERGAEVSRVRVTGDDLLFMTLDRLTSDLAHQAEMRGRGGSPYSRWRWMDAHVRLMRHLDPAWGQRLADRYDKVLAERPLRADEAFAGLSPLDLSGLGVD